MLLLTSEASDTTPQFWSDSYYSSVLRQLLLLLTFAATPTVRHFWSNSYYSSNLKQLLLLLNVEATPTTPHFWSNSYYYSILKHLLLFDTFEATPTTPQFWSNSSKSSTFKQLLLFDTFEANPTTPQFWSNSYYSSLFQQLLLFLTFEATPTTPQFWSNSCYSLLRQLILLLLISKQRLLPLLTFKATPYNFSLLKQLFPLFRTFQATSPHFPSEPLSASPLPKQNSPLYYWRKFLILPTFEDVPPPPLYYLGISSAPSKILITLSSSYLSYFSSALISEVTLHSQCQLTPHFFYRIPRHHHYDVHITHTTTYGNVYHMDTGTE